MPSETDLVIAHHPYEPQREDELKLDQGETITVTDRSDPDWWVGKKDDGSTGFFPSNFVAPAPPSRPPPVPAAPHPERTLPKEPAPEAIDQNKEEQLQEDANEETVSTAAAADTEHAELDPAKPIGMARVMEDYAMQNPDELTLHRGGIVNVYERYDDGWLKGELNGKMGRFPAEFVEDIDMPGRPDLGQQMSPGAGAGAGVPKKEGEEEADAGKPAFKLAAYGVKQGGIGSLLAGGFPTLKKAGAPKKPEAKPEMASPPAASPPVASPPVASPPVASPPVASPPVASPPVASPPVASPPVTSSPVTSPPAVASPPVPTSAAEEPPKAERSQAIPGAAKLGKAIVLHPYDAENEDELNLLRGEYIDILDRNVDDGWWKGTTERGQTGVFPSNFVKEIEEQSSAPPPPARTRKSVTSTGSQQSFVSASPVSPAQMARAPPLPDKSSRPSSLASSRPGSVHEQQQPAQRSSIAPESPAPIPEEPISEDKPAPVTAGILSPPAAAPPPPARKDSVPSVKEEEKEENAEPHSPKQEEEAREPTESTAISAAEESVPEEPSKTEESLTKDEEEKSETAESLAAQSPPPPVASVTPPAVSDRPPVAPSTSSQEAVIDSPAPETPKAEEKENSVKTASPEISPEETKVDDEKEAEAGVEDSKPVEEPSSVEEKPKVGEELPKEEEHAAAPVASEENDKPKEAESEEMTAPGSTEAEEAKRFDLAPTGPKLSAPSRARPGRGRRSPASETKQEPSQMELLQQELANTPEEKPAEEVEEKSTPSPPAKPVKPIFAKFPTPFAGGGEISTKNLKPVQRRMWEPAPEHEPSKEVEKKDDEPPRPAGVRNIASRFNMPSSGNEVLETKLKNFCKNEIEKVRKELEQERAKREELEKIVLSLAEKVEQLARASS